MKTKSLLVVLLLTSMLFFPTQKVQADECTTVWVPDPPPNGSFKTVCSGGSSGGGDNPPSSGCTPGTTIMVSEYVPYPLDPAICRLVVTQIDICTGEILWVGVDYDQDIACHAEGDASDPSPCTVFEVSGNGIHCVSQWYVEARVGFPEMFLDARPYPATLVRWPTAVRCGGLSLASDSGTLDYVSYGGGSEESPNVGDWRDLKLTLRLEPAGPLFLTLPHVGTLVLPDVGATGQPVPFQWELPSHPAAGGGLLAGNVSSLGNLPPDIPLFAGHARSPYRLFWRLTYEEYDRDRECETGPNAIGKYQCRTSSDSLEDDGHWEYYYEWENRSRGGEVHPSQVQGVPPNLIADLNGDGIPDAYWNNNVTLRRMDDNNRVDNPQWTASWNWGGTVYWAVREGQGQVGWP